MANVIAGPSGDVHPACARCSRRCSARHWLVPVGLVLKLTHYRFFEVIDAAGLN
jgi:hypothetical protein